MNDIKFNVEQINGVININFEEIREQLAAGLEEYRGMVFTEDSKTEAKKTVASLRKLKKAISDRRIEVKKSFMQPYDTFEAQVKELDKLIDEPINLINEQVAEFERKRIEERKKEIGLIYEESIGSMNDYLPLSKIYNTKWENVTTSKKAIKEEIEERVNAVKQDVDVIKEMQTDAVDKALDFYRKTLSLTDTIQFINDWEKQKAEILKKQEEEKKATEREVEEKPLDIPHESNSIPTKGEEPIPQEKEPDLEDGLKEVTFVVKADMLQLAQLESVFNQLGIEYWRV